MTRRGNPPKRVDVSCFVCGNQRSVRPSLIKRFEFLVCASCTRPKFPQRAGFTLIWEMNVAGYFDGYYYRPSSAEDEESFRRASAILQAAKRQM